ncbi:MAG: alpha-amylase family glycosyl hydrolase, partial [Candidatus Hodarchaeales archaeon]
MRINQITRDQYQIEEDFFKTKEGYIKFPDIYSVRLFVDKINQKRNLIQYPEMALKASEINGMSLIYEIYHHIFDLYQKEKAPELYKELLNDLKRKIGEKNLKETLMKFVEEFPPPSVYNKSVTAEEYLKQKTEGLSNKEVAMKELIHLWLENTNPAFNRHLDFFNDENLEKKTDYNKIMEEIDQYFRTKEPFGPKNQYLLELLKTPERAHPHSIKEQLEFIAKEWRPLLDSY